MARYDWIVVPSTWWENSPVVIQEALAIGKPLICSRIGGMVEKAGGPNVVLFEVGDAKDLAGKINSVSLHKRRPIAKPPSPSLDLISAMLSIYREVVSGLGRHKI